MLRLYDTFAVLTNEMAKKKAGGSNLVLPGEPLTKPYRKYLIKRGLDPDEIIEKYGVKAGGIVGDWKYRLMIPIYQDKLLVSYHSAMSQSPYESRTPQEPRKHKHPIHF